MLVQRNCGLSTPPAEAVSGRTDATDAESRSRELTGTSLGRAADSGSPLTQTGGAVDARTIRSGCRLTAVGSVPPSISATMLSMLRRPSSVKS